jgi:ribosomal protein L13E
MPWSDLVSRLPHKQGGYNAMQAKAVHYVQGLKEGGFTVADARAGGFSLAEVKQAGFVDGLKEPFREGGGTDASQTGWMKKLVRGSQRPGYTVAEVMNAGYRLEDCRVAGYSVKEVREAGYKALVDEIALIAIIPPPSCTTRFLP